MPIEIVVVPCLQDNYAYLVRDSDRGTVALIDAPEAGAIEAALEARGWDLGAILVTHHHDDHVAGVARLRERYGAKVVGAAADRDRLPPLDREVAEGDTGGAGGFAAEVIDVPGHTRGHIAYYFPEAKALFSADSLMAMGCGRLFEGTAAEMWASLSKLAALPPDTRVYSGHEYTESNLRFAEALDPEHPPLAARAAAIRSARAAGRDTMGATLAEERATNPFLRAAEPALKARLGMEGAPDAEVFAEIRRRKDVF
jgi:hydroxyacylglutathione hydrolase